NLPGATLESIRRSGGLPLPAAGYRVAWENVEAPRRVTPRDVGPLSATIRNAGPCSWPPSVHLGWRWRPSGEGVSAIESPARVLPGRWFRPGETARLRADLTAPAAEGSYVLELDLVHENLTWFSARGGSVARAPVEVGPAQGQNPAR